MSRGFFWTLATAVAARERLVPAGVAMGFGILSKYAMLLWSIGLLFTTMRKRALIPVAIALPFLIPMIVWNAQHGWVTLANIAADLAQYARWTFPEFIGGQLLAVGPVVVGVAGPGWGPCRGWRGLCPPRSLLPASSVPSLAFLRLR